MKRLLTVAVVAVIIAGCGDGATSGASSTTTSTTTPSSTTIGTPMPPTGETLATMIEEAKADLASRTGVVESAIEVVKAEAVTWPNGALGCPKPGMSYTQALVDGYQVVLMADGRAYDYHAGPDGEPFLCASDEKDGGRDFVPPPGIDR
ncbi:MAG: hypothetical protein J5I28_01030 [Acidimicrobiales bacterium]|nr:hypothetical protein [Acidimicrobiales bacterium]HLV90682.1 hypothetical protein [Acidimicrobiia bacterium]